MLEPATPHRSPPPEEPPLNTPITPPVCATSLHTVPLAGRATLSDLLRMLSSEDPSATDPEHAASRMVVGSASGPGWRPAGPPRCAQRRAVLCLHRHVQDLPHRRRRLRTGAGLRRTPGGAGLRRALHGKPPHRRQCAGGLHRVCDPQDRAGRLQPRRAGVRARTAARRQPGAHPHPGPGGRDGSRGLRRCGWPASCCSSPDRWRPAASRPGAFTCAWAGATSPACSAWRTRR